MQSRQGVLSEADLAAHRTAIVPPISTVYKGHRVYEVPPPTQVRYLLKRDPHAVLKVLTMLLRPMCCCVEGLCRCLLSDSKRKGAHVKQVELAPANI